MGREALSVEYLKGMLITFSHIFKKKATISYPEQKRAFSPVFRGLQILNRDEEGVNIVQPAVYVQLPVLQKQ